MCFELNNATFGELFTSRMFNYRLHQKQAGFVCSYMPVYTLFPSFTCVEEIWASPAAPEWPSCFPVRGQGACCRTHRGTWPPPRPRIESPCRFGPGGVNFCTRRVGRFSQLPLSSRSQKPGLEGRDEIHTRFQNKNMGMKYYLLVGLRIKLCQLYPTDNSEEKWLEFKVSTCV